MKLKRLALLVSLLFISKCIYAKDITVNMNLTSDNKSIGVITAKDTPYGLLFIPNLTDLSPGIHGFHVHVNPICDKKGMAAGGHLDPDKTDKHLGPFTNKGHLGDLPILIADKDGHSTLPVLAPRLKLQDIKHHSLMIHEGGDNYSDTPKLGGGGERVACGVVE